MSRPGTKTFVAAFAALLLLSASAAVSAADAAPPDSLMDPARPGRLVRLPGGRQMNFRCSGAGAPTVVLEGGFEATSLAWYKVQPLVAAHHRVCSYDRAGSGFSDPGPLPRDGAAIARDLDLGLKAAGIKGRIVLVGHSSGGLYVRLFANRRPREVAGMVLIDPSVEHQDARFAAVFGPGAGDLTALRQRTDRCLTAAKAAVLPSLDPKLAACAPPQGPTESVAAYQARLVQALRPSTWETQLSELDNLWTTTSDEIDAGRQSYGAMPLIVLTAGDAYAAAPEPARSAATHLWTQLHQEIAARSTRGRAEVVTGASHLMMLTRPDAIAASIDEVIAAADHRKTPLPGR